MSQDKNVQDSIEHDDMTPELIAKLRNETGQVIEHDDMTPELIARLKERTKGIKEGSDEDYFPVQSGLKKKLLRLRDKLRQRLSS